MTRQSAAMRAPRAASVHHLLGFYCASVAVASAALTGCGGGAEAECGAGTFDDDPSGVTTCVAFTTCGAGTYVGNQPDATQDRLCSACPPDSFSTDVNASSCTPHLPCASGSRVVVPATPSTQAVCERCAAGVFCAGGDAAPDACGLATGTWDDDADASTPCQPQDTCDAGEEVTVEGSALADRECGACAAGTYSTEVNAVACADLSVCDPGDFIAAAGTSTRDQVCAPCPSGTFSDADDAAACVTWRTCAPGTFVSADGSTLADRECTVCEGGTHTTGPNQSLCVESDACAPGTYQVAPGTDTAPPTCAACVAGEYCAGAANPRVACNVGAPTWDADDDPATACTPRSSCGAGTFVDAEGDAVTDRTCAGCEAGTFSAGDNAPSCTPWQSCGAETVESAPPTATADRVCEPDWVRQVGTAGGDRAWAVDTTAAGEVVAAGYTAGSLFGPSAGGVDVWVGKWDRQGNLVWGDQFGTTGGDTVTDVVIDALGEVYITGYVDRSLAGQTHLGDLDAYVRKYAADGSVLWTRQLGTDRQDTGQRLQLGAGGALYLAGTTIGTLGASNAGSGDVFVSLFDAAGTAQWTTQFGSPNYDRVQGLEVDSDGNVYIAGIAEGVLTGETGAGGYDAYLVKLGPTGQEVFRDQFGTATDDQAYGVALSPEGVTVTGRAGGALGGASAGAGDVFVRRYDVDGAVQWTTQFGSNLDDHPIGGVAVLADGSIYVGGYAGGSLPGQVSSGSFDMFAARLSSTGALQVVRQLGGSVQDVTQACKFESSGAVVLVGYTMGTLPGQTSLGGDDVFLARFGAL